MFMLCSEFIKQLITKCFGWLKFSYFKYKDTSVDLRSASKKKNLSKLQEYSRKILILHSLDNHERS